MTRSNQKQPTDKKPVVANKVAKSELKVIPISLLSEVRGGYCDEGGITGTGVSL